jgi:para-nitrobenzyl esterase
MPCYLYLGGSSERYAEAGNIGQQDLIAALQQGVAPAFMYYFTYGPPILDGRFQAFHTAELPLVFRPARYPKSEQLSRQLAGAWAAFARSGNPSLANLPWPAYTLDQRPTMIFGGIDSHSTNDPDRETRLFLQSLPRADRVV